MRLRNIKNKEEILNNSKYIILNPKEYKGKWNNVFKNNNPIYIEIGMGKGKFILENALKYPNINFIGIEKYDSVIARAIKKIDEREINNLKLIRIDANELNDVFDKEIDLIYLTFSDPWPKDRHAKRRLSHSDFLKIYDDIFKNYKKIDKVLLGTIILALIGLIFYGHVANQAVSWYKIGPFAIQPSEFAKIIIIIYLAVYYSKNKDKLDNQWNIIKPMIFIVIIAVLVALQPDMGTAVIIGLIALAIFYATPMEKKSRSIFNKIFIGGILLVVLVLIVAGGKFLQSYQLDRFNYFNPCDRYQEKTGYQLCNSFIAFKNGGIKGQGLGGSTQKYLYLPESYTDFIFPVIVEELGLVIGIVILGIYAYIIFRILKIAKKSYNLMSGLMCYGVAAYIFIHIFVNLTGILGLLPLTGVPLPFLSYGGSSMITNFILIGLLLNISGRRQKAIFIE